MRGKVGRRKDERKGERERGGIERGEEEGKKGGGRFGGIEGNGGKKEDKRWEMKGERRDRKEELYVDLGKMHSQKKDHQV